MESIQRKIVEAEDIADIIALMVNLNIETKGCKNIEQMQERICQHLNAREQLDPNKVGTLTKFTFLHRKMYLHRLDHLQRAFMTPWSSVFVSEVNS